MFSSYLIWTLLSFQVCCAIDACFVVQPSPSPKSNPLPVPPRPALLGSIPSLRHSASSTIARDFNSIPFICPYTFLTYANFPVGPICIFSITFVVNGLPIFYLNFRLDVVEVWGFCSWVEKPITAVSHMVTHALVLKHRSLSLSPPPWLVPSCWGMFPSWHLSDDKQFLEAAAVLIQAEAEISSLKSRGQCCLSTRAFNELSLLIIISFASEDFGLDINGI